MDGIPVPRCSVADLAEGAAAGPLLGENGEVIDPLLFVDLGPADAGTLGAATHAVATAHRVLVGVVTGEPDERWRGLARALDVTLVPGGAARLGPEFACGGDPVADAAALHAAATACPRATLTLAQVLRATEPLGVRAALDVESFAYSTLLGGAEFARWLSARGTRPLPPPAAEPVLLARADGLLRITLNRPERRNAYGRELRDALTDALRLATVDDTITRVVLDGAGPSFCAGGDLDEFGTTPDLATAHLVRTRAGAGPLLHTLAERAEVRVHGSCVGAGIELPAFAGRVVAAPGTTFRLPEVSMGLLPGAGGTVSIPRRIGRWRTLFAALSGRAIDTDTALEWGLVDAVESGPS
ncbi:enoyl-CoA hydratase [Prauserella sp. PE36]|uniref:enoyl-CoA hydratase/isomerase family protein n=1 Tax=Prauserella sp. PE36 TaxID=1504709 RepID=UPI000DE24CE8|nr:enoyl-CoA hydratase/isomerase family protein [Prauserella sp. PE36]RBM16269.1 enoyl-CoA hydratase [Prauserella sp. PE36]